MREYREVRVRTNVPEEAGEYLGFARTLLGQLKNEMKFAKLLQGVRRKRLRHECGAVDITVMSIFGQDTIRIHIPPCEPTTSETVEHESYIPRWIFVVVGIYSDTYYTAASQGDVYVVDCNTHEPRLLIERENFGLDPNITTSYPDGLINTFWGSFDWRSNLLLTSWRYDSSKIGLAIIDPVNGDTIHTWQEQNQSGGPPQIHAICGYKRVAYALIYLSRVYLQSPVFSLLITGPDTEEEYIDLTEYEWISNMFISHGGRYLLMCQDAWDIADAPWYIRVYDIEQRRVVLEYAVPYLSEYDTTRYAWDHKNNRLYLHIDSGAAPNDTSKLFRYDFDEDDVTITNVYEVDLRAGWCFAMAADSVYVVMSTYHGYTTEPGYLQYIDAETGEFVVEIADPARPSSQWPQYIVSDDHGVIYGYGAASEDDSNFRLLRWKSGAINHIYDDHWIPFCYGEGKPIKIR